MLLNKIIDEMMQNRDTISLSATYISLKPREKQMYEEEIYNNVDSPYYLPF